MCVCVNAQYILMIINKVGRKLLLNSRIMMQFGGAAHKPYDWRDDHVANPDYDQNVRMIGARNPETYTYPYSVDPKVDEIPDYNPSHPADYDQKNLYTNMTGTTHWGRIRNNMDTGGTDYMADAAHEYDYESEDLDFQAESFATQHFRKKGAFWMWLIAGTTPLWFFGSELFLQYWPEDDNWRYQRPPPLNYPDDQETPDTEYHKMFKSIPHMNLYDAGVVNAPFFDIVDGKKVYTKWAGVNQPRDVL